MKLVDAIPFLEETYALSVRSCIPFGTGVVNRNFHVSADEGEFVWKINSHKRMEHMLDELAMLRACSHLPVPHVRRDVHGYDIHQYNGHCAWLYDLIKGHALSFVDVDMVRAMGEMLGRIHVACSDLSSSEKSGRWDHVSLCELMDDFLKDHSTHAFGDEVDLNWVRSHMDRFDFPELPQGMTHQDMKPENILVSGGEIVGVLDFDNAYYGALIHDVHTIAIWTCVTDGMVREDMLDALYAGYESVRPFAEVERAVLRESLLFRLLREVFIGPFAATRVTDGVLNRSVMFLNVYKKTLVW